MRIFLIFFSAAILIAFTDAQRKLNMTKPLVNLEKRPRPVWSRPPEERRKLSIFPRNNMKFVVTPKTVKNDDEANEGLPTKRPLMRKFVMQDRNEKGTWSFAPREPLMKTQRFTVTLAPTKSSYNKATDEMNPEESKKVQTVIRNVKSESKSSKPLNISKGNLIDIVTSKYDLFASKKLHKIERNLTKEDISETIKINDTKNSEIVQMNDNKTLPTFGESLIDVRSFNDDVILEDNRTTIQNRDGHNNVNKTTELSNIKISEHLIESRALDFNDMTYPVNQNENNSLIIDSEGSNNLETGQILPINDLEILLEKIVNNTEQSNNNSTLKLKDNGTLITQNNETSITMKDIPQIDVTKPNTFYEVVSLSNEDKENTNLGEDLSPVSFIFNTTNDKKHSVSETNALNDEDDFTEHVGDTLVMGNLESLINFIENSTVGPKNIVKLQGLTGNDFKNNEDFKMSDDFTAEYTTSRSDIDNKTSQYPVNNTEVEYQTQFPEEFNKTDSDGSDAHDLSLEIYESNMPLSSEETSIEGDEYDSQEPTPGNLNILMEETSNEELMDNYSLSLEEISNTSISDSSNYYAEERSNESLIDKSNNLTNEHISNESYSNIAGEELSDDSYADKSNNLTEEIPSESSVKSSNNYTGEQFSNESSNLAAEELSNESYYVDKSNNLAGEISSNSITDYSNNSNEQILNESSSVIAEEEISNESYLTDDTSKEIIEASNNFTEELISNESSSNVAGEEMSNESYLTDDITKESIESSNHFSEEQTSNVSFNISGGDIANVSKESIEILSNITSEEVFIDNVDVRMSEDQADSSYDRSVGGIAEEALINRFKRSNIIEEENLPTTVSGFKYTGHEVRLNQDSIYKNINA